MFLCLEVPLEMSNHLPLSTRTLRLPLSGHAARQTLERGLHRTCRLLSLAPLSAGPGTAYSFHQSWWEWCCFFSGHPVHMLGCDIQHLGKRDLGRNQENKKRNPRPFSSSGSIRGTVRGQFQDGNSENKFGCSLRCKHIHPCILIVFLIIFSKHFPWLFSLV